MVVALTGLKEVGAGEGKSEEFGLNGTWLVLFVGGEVGQDPA